MPEFKCEICGQTIDQNVKCPYCGAETEFIHPVEEK